MKKEELERKKTLLELLQEDIEIFGPTADDLIRIRKLKEEIKSNE